MLDEPATNHWSNSGCDRTKTRPCANRPSAFLFWKRTADDGETTGNKQSCTESLGSTSHDQLMYVGCKAAPRGRRCKKSNANQEDPASSVVISQRSADKQKRRKEKRISLDDPLHVD